MASKDQAKKNAAKAKKSGGLKEYLKGVKIEMSKVVWPTKTDVFASLKVVIISTIIVAVLLGLLDFGFTEAFRALMK